MLFFFRNKNKTMKSDGHVSYLTKTSAPKVPDTLILQA